MRRCVPVAAALLALGCRSTPEPPPAKDAQPARAGPVIAVDSETVADQDLDALLAPYRSQVDAAMRDVVGHAPKPIERARPEGALGNLVSDAIRAAAKQATGREVHVAFTNAGGIRNDIPAGDVTIGALFEVMPFDNTIVVFELSGKEVALVLDTAAARGGDPVSGARYTIHGERAVEVSVGGEPLAPSARYRPATNDYVFDGGSRFQGLDKATGVVRTGVLVRDALIEALQRMARDSKTLEVSTDGRVQIHREGDG